MADPPPVAEWFADTSLGPPGVRGFLHRPLPVPGPGGGGAGDGLVLTHGAGSDANASLLVSIADAFAARGVTVLRCDLPFRQARPTGPPRPGAAATDREGLRRAIGAMRQIASGRVFLGGHSYGGRQASMLAAAEPAVADALLLLSYPLHPPRRPAELRTEHFPALRTPALFVHGSADPFGSLDELEAARWLIAGPTRLMAIEGGRHELTRARPGSRTAVALANVVADRFLAWVHSVPRSR